MQRNTPFLSMAAFSLLAVIPACGGGQEPPTGQTLKLSVEPGDSPSVKAAKEKWAMLCVTCHGTTGKGDGPAGKALTPKPRSFADKDWQAGVEDSYLNDIISKGGAAVGKSPLMPGAPDLASDPAAIEFLVKIVRSWGQ